MVRASWLWATAMVVLGASLSPSAFAQTMATSAALQVTLPSGTQSHLPLVDEDVDVVIDQQHATTKLRYMYQNTSGSQLEGRFILRAGGGSTVHRFAYWNGEQKIVGEVFEKALATKIYEDTVNQRRDPGLLTKTGEGTFSFRVFPIQANEHKRIELELDEWLSRSDKTVEYRIPVTRKDADVRIELLDDRPIGRIVSSSHKLDVERSNGRVIVKSDGMRGTRTELVLRYELLDKPWTISAALHRDADHDGFLMLSLPAPPMKGAIAKDVTLVIDRSGSMLGEPLEHAKRAAQQIVDKLAVGDRFNVLAFDDAVDGLFSAPKAVNAKSKDRAARFIDRIDEGGGTDIALALTSAFAKQHSDARPKTVLFLTDGKSESKEALETAKNDKGDVRVFTVGLGDKVDKPLLSRLAAEKRGRFTYVESASTLPARMSKLYDNISAPALVGVTIDVEGEDANLYRTYPRSLPDVFNGDELLVVSRIQGSGEIKVMLSGQTVDGPITVERTLSVASAVKRRWVGRLWARSRVDHLLEEMALHGPNDELVSETKELGLAYNLLTPYTAFLAIPESELTTEGRRLLAAARDQKDEALAFNPDAAALRERHGAADNMSAPAMEPMAPPAAESGGAWGGRGGCASCSTGESAPSGVDVGVWLLVALGLSRLRRRGSRGAGRRKRR